jgi:mannose-6-phosphate isomerase-like protein (cupin superfamily)
MNGVNLAQKLATFSEHYTPRTVGQFNGHDLMVVKVKGPFVWHRHEDTDDFFLVLKGRSGSSCATGTSSSVPGELYVVPKGVEHRPVADEEAHILLIEPTGTPNTGDASDGRASRRHLSTRAHARVAGLTARPALRHTLRRRGVTAPRAPCAAGAGTAPAAGRR